MTSSIGHAHVVHAAARCHFALKSATYSLRGSLLCLLQSWSIVRSCVGAGVTVVTAYCIKMLWFEQDVDFLGLKLLSLAATLMKLFSLAATLRNSRLRDQSDRLLSELHRVSDSAFHDVHIFVHVSA